MFYRYSSLKVSNVSTSKNKKSKQDTSALRIVANPSIEPWLFSAEDEVRGGDV